MRPVLLATLEYPPHVGGIAQYLANLVSSAPAGMFTVLAPETENAHVMDMLSDAPIYRRSLLWKNLKPGWLPALSQVDRLCRHERPSALVISHLLPMGRIARYAKLRHGTPYLVILHGMDIALALSSPNKRAQARAILHGAEKVVVNSRYTARLASALEVPQEKIMVVHPTPGIARNAVADDVSKRVFRKKFSLGDKFTIFSIGRLVNRKGFDTVIEALAELKERGLDLRYLVAGAGPERNKLVRLAEQLGLKDEVVFAGSIDSEDLPAAYSATDLFVTVPSGRGADVEGFGTVYLEAGLMGRPVIGSRSGGVPEAVLHGHTGLLVNPGQVEELADAIAIIHDFPEFRCKLGMNGRKRALHEFNPDYQTRELIDFLSALN